MPANTPGGWPYVLPADHPLEFPAHSQALAQKIESGMQSTWTPAAGWVDMGSAFAGLKVTREGPLVVVEGLLKNTNGLATVQAGQYTLGSLPAGYRPSRTVISPSVLSYAGTPFVSTRVDFMADGTVQLNTFTGGTFTANSGWVAVLGTFRGA